MSHTVKIDTQIKQSEQASIVAALAVFGWTEVKEKSTRRAWNNNDNTIYDLVFVNPKGNQDIGLNFDKEGNGEVMTDTYDSTIEQQLGGNLCRFKQEYAAQVIEEHARWDNATVSRSVDAQGNLTLEVTY